MILLDTNILICQKHTIHPLHTTVTQKLIQLVTEGNELIICPQTMYELYVVATRPTTSRGGLGLSSATALKILDDLKSTHSFMNDPDTLFTSWQQLMVDYGTMGKDAHDARLVAFMKAHGIEQLYTNNTKDFTRYTSFITLVI